MLDEIMRIKKMQKPTGFVDVILDTDTYNEIDDQFALSYLVRSEEKLRLQAVYAAPFLNHVYSVNRDAIFQDLFQKLAR